jgi:hypothetical protein
MHLPWCVCRQEEQLDPLPVRRYPGLDLPGLVHLEIVDDQEQLAPGAADQALQEGKKQGCVQRAFMGRTSERDGVLMGSSNRGPERKRFLR